MALPTRYRDRDRSPGVWNPVAELERTARQMSQLFEDAFRGLPSIPDDAFTPFADLEETDDAYLIEVELPGVKKDDVDVECQGRRITVSGERKEQERKGVLRKRTRSVGRFFHEVVLPGDIDEDGVSASLEEGVLTLRVPKAEHEQKRTRKVSIR